MKYKLLILPLLCLLLSSKAYSQITIGNGESPVAGSLLQLKNIDGITNGDANANRGLSLPKVTINNIKPTTDAELAASIGGTGSYSMVDHIGLIVYNTAELPSANICKGIHIWDGGEWAPLNPISKFDITMTDADGNVYSARWFGSNPCNPTNGLYWMRSNIYSTQKGTGGAFTTGQPYINNGNYDTGGEDAIAIGGISTTKMITYGSHPDQTTANTKNITESQKDFAIKYGLGYNHDQAMEVCPNGWRLPTLAEFNAMKNSLGSTDAEQVAAMRANYNHYSPADRVGTLNWGVKTDVLPSGFDAYPSGDGKKQFFRFAYWWTSDVYRIALYNPDAVNTMLDPNPPLNYLTVRCVQN